MSKDMSKDMSNKDINENSETITIQTHDGRFHCDDVTAVCLLTNYFGSENKKTSIIRSRDETLFNKSDILIDVGKVYDPENNRFDHHQQECTETWNEYSKVPLSSVGLVWKHYGIKIVDKYLQAFQYDCTSKDIDSLVNKLYYKIFLEIDANDNGIALETKNLLNLPSLVGSCNGRNTEDSDSQNENFQIAVNLVSKILEIKFKEIIQEYFDFMLDLEIVKNGMEIFIDKEYLIIPSTIKTVYKCLNKLDPEYRIKFLIFVSDDEYTIRTRRKIGTQFNSIVDILSENKLNNLLDYPEDLIFVHKNLFICKCKTETTAVEIVELSLKHNNNFVSKIKNLKNINPKYGKVALLGTIGVLGGYWYLKNYES